MRKIIAVILFMTLVLQLSFAVSFTSGIYEYGKSSEDGSIELFACNPVDGQTVLNIPEDIDSKPVSKISDDLPPKDFLKSQSIEEITIPASVTYIAPSSFSEATALKYITVSPDNPRYASIQGVLYNKKNKSLLCYPQAREDSSFAVPDGISVIDSYAFYGTANLENVHLPDSIKYIGTSSFENSGLVSINFPEGIETIDSGAFFNCNSLLEVELPASLTLLGYEPFVSRSLKSISISPDNPVFCSVDGVLFSKDMSVLITYPSSKSYGGEYVVPESVKIMDHAAFCYAKLGRIVLPANLEKIGNSAFWGSWIFEITLPAPINYIGEEVFDSCTWLNTINVTEGSYAFKFGLERNWGKYITYDPSWLK